MKKSESIRASHPITRRQAAAGIAAVVAAGVTPLVRAQAAKEPVLVGVAVPTTMSFGQRNIRGIDLAIKQLNAAGGLGWAAAQDSGLRRPEQARRRGLRGRAAHYPR